MLPSNMLLLNLILLIDVTFSTPTPDYNSRAEPTSTIVQRKAAQRSGGYVLP